MILVPRRERKPGTVGRSTEATNDEADYLMIVPQVQHHRMHCHFTSLDQLKLS